MSKFAVIGTIEVAPGRMKDFLPLLTAHRDRCLRDEPGTLQFEVLMPRDDETKVLLYEVYSDQAAFDAHWSGASTKRIREEAGDMIAKVYGTFCIVME